MIPDEMLVYEPHHVGYARHGTSWYRVIANYGGGDLVLAPQPATQDEVEHKFCKAGCRRTRYVRKAKWLLRQPEPTVEAPLPPAPVRATSRKALSFSVALALLLGFGSGVATTVFFMSPPPALQAETPSHVPSPGALHRHDKLWWRVEEVFAQDALTKDKKAAGRYQSHLKAGKLVVPFEYSPDEDSPEKTALLVLTPAHPPLGIMMNKGAGKLPDPSAFVIPQPIPGQTKQGAPGPPKAQWK